MDESTLNFRGIRSNFAFICHFSMKFNKANRIAQDGTPPLRRHICGYSFPMSNKKDARLIWVRIPEMATMYHMQPNSHQP